jgi:hypothetical protein
MSKLAASAFQLIWISDLAYGNEDLGNRNVEDQDLAGRTGIVSCSEAEESFSCRLAIRRTRFQAQRF